MNTAPAEEIGKGKGSDPVCETWQCLKMNVSLFNLMYLFFSKHKYISIKYTKSIFRTGDYYI